MKLDLYYSPPEDKQFEELKQKAIEVWETYDNRFGYVDEKVGKIKNMENISDNFMYIVAMFDMSNQKRLADRLSSDTKKAVRDRMVAGGQPEEYIVF